MQWIIKDTYIIGTTGSLEKLLKTSSKVAAFDLDDTLIKPSSLDKNGKLNKFSVSDTDWQLYDNTIKEKLTNLYNDGYSIVIITNQNGISIGKIDKETWMEKICNFHDKIGIPITVLASIEKDKYRKPCTGLWDKYIKCDKKSSFYCGDAGGLPKRKINKMVINKDFSDTDLKFALNLGIKFIHRDEFIYDTILKIDIPKHPFMNTYGKYNFVPNTPEMIIMVGYPGSGKTYYSTNYICSNSSYVHINRDTLKTPQKCYKECENSIKNGLSVVIDNTNPDKKSRAEYIKIAKKYNIKYRCIIFNTSNELSQHNNYYRSITTGSSLVPSIVYNIYNKKYEKPEINEGYYNIEEMEFRFEDKNEEYEKYYL